MFCEDAKDLVERRAAGILASMDRLLEGELPGLAFDKFRNGRKAQAVRCLDLPSPNLWIIGDLHGDLLALEVALKTIDGVSQAEGLEAPIVVFLGDLVDRGPSSLEVVLRVFERVVQQPGQVCLLAGNHSDALRLEDDGRQGKRMINSRFPV